MSKKWYYALGGFLAGSFFSLGKVLKLVRGR